jgi:UDP-glucose 4-epimerase
MTPVDHEMQFTDVFRNKEVLITGGLGFIGSNLAARLVGLGARVTLLDSMLEDHGGNLFNIEPIKDQVDVNFSDVRDDQSLKYLIKGKDYIFHLASQNDHILSRQNPFPDIEINIRGTTNLLDNCRKYNRDARLIYSGTRGEYGSAIKLPVSEDQPLNPRGVYELSSMAAQQLFKIYHQNDGVRSVTLRLTNIYGERSQMKHNRYGVANWFVRLAMDDKCISVFGDGRIIRDFLHVSDTVEAMLAAAACEAAYGQVLNVGNDQGSSFRELAETIVEVAGTGQWQFTPFSPERAAQEPGDFISDITRIKQLTGWKPTTSLHAGLEKTISFYRQHKEHYW